MPASPVAETIAETTITSGSQGLLDVREAVRFVRLRLDFALAVLAPGQRRDAGHAVRVPGPRRTRRGMGGGEKDVWENSFLGACRKKNTSSSRLIGKRSYVDRYER